MRKQHLALVLAILVCLGALVGCTVTTHEKDNGKKDDVDIHTPFGSLSVRQDQTNVKDTGLTPYPGAQLRKDSNDDDHDSANVNISSSLFGLKVVAMKFKSDDAPDKVLSFYRKDMGKYGKVVDCSGGFNMSFHHHDQDAEVTCDGHDTDDKYKEVLKVGTENNQRVIAVGPSGKGSVFALVYVRAWDKKDTM
ncbi:MAG TPA: hypothetical protein VFB76_02795 [Candidatus Angelobacter sp.]|nr:hypothetical protein [Candidatus Angelobacter sp.]